MKSYRAFFPPPLAAGRVGEFRGSEMSRGGGELTKSSHSHHALRTWAGGE